MKPPTFPPQLQEWRPGQPFEEAPLPAWMRETQPGCAGCNPGPRCASCADNPVRGRPRLDIGIYEGELRRLSARLRPGISARELHQVSRSLLDLAREAGRVGERLGLRRPEFRWELGWVRSRALRATEDLVAALWCQEELERDTRLLPQRRAILKECLAAALRAARETLLQPYGAPLPVAPIFVSAYLERLKASRVR